jgi:hypothetical protein
MEDFTKALTYEIKQDIANRYFGFRKRIETESSQYCEKLRSANQEYAAGIKMDMQRMGCLLKKDHLLRSFIKYTGLPETIGCYCGNLQSPAQWQLLFTDLKGEGLTRGRRYRNLMYKVYRSLTGNIAAYRKIFLELKEEHEDICREIDRFYRKNDLSYILNFLREIDNPDGVHSGILQADRAGIACQNMERELRLAPPPAVTTSMHLLIALPTLEEAKPTLINLGKQAYPLLDRLDLDRLPI